jgi:hypothetical protein
MLFQWRAVRHAESAVNRRPVLFVRPGTSEKVLSETGKGGSRAGILADRLRHMADQLDAMVVS